MTDEPIFICDPPPGPRWILRCDHPLSPNQAKRLREVWDEAMNNPKRTALVFDSSISIEVFPGRYEWPDAEFCAA